MKNKCCVSDCKNDVNKGHLFPKNDDLQKLLLRAIKRENWKPGKWSKICSKHFVESDYLHVTTLGKFYLT